MKKWIILVLIVILVGVGFGVFSSISSDKKGAPNQETVAIDIPSGATLNDITLLLKQSKVIKYPALFKLHAKDSGQSTYFTAGLHSFTAKMGYDAIVQELCRIVPLAGIVKVTIPEGYELREIAALLETNGLVSSQDFINTANNTTFEGYEFLKDIPQREVRLEGYLFPATYDFQKEDVTSEQILKTMLDRFAIMLTPQHLQRAQQLNLTLDQVVTLASIIEREAAGDSDRSTVASVFHNRLKSNDMPYLQSCATVQYILEERKNVLSEKDTTIQSPYNTYINKGLPIGPISNPGEQSFLAALYPDETPYLYFVVGKDGSHIFSQTYDQHLAAMNP